MNNIKRYHKTLKDAKKYLASLTFQYGLRIWGVKVKNKETGRMNTAKYWIGTEFEWLNRY